MPRRASPGCSPRPRKARNSGLNDRPRRWRNPGKLRPSDDVAFFPHATAMQGAQRRESEAADALLPRRAGQQAGRRRRAGARRARRLRDWRIAQPAPLPGSAVLSLGDAHVGACARAEGSTEPGAGTDARWSSHASARVAVGGSLLSDSVPVATPPRRRCGGRLQDGRGAGREQAVDATPAALAHVKLGGARSAKRLAQLTVAAPAERRGGARRELTPGRGRGSFPAVRSPGPRL
jgi:hypothetical protein